MKKGPVFKSNNWNLKDAVKKNFDTKRFAQLAQRTITDKVIQSMSRGISPVQGQRNFEKYRNPKKYPGDLKASNKPNLRLSGKLWSAYKSKVAGLMSISLGIHSDVPEDVKVYATANNEGTMNSKQSSARDKFSKARGTKKNRKKILNKILKGSIPARRFVPIKGESYKTDIVLELRKHLAGLLMQATKRRRK